jgi:hypothetical protein
MAPPRASLGRRVGSAAAGALPPAAGSEKRTRPGRPGKWWKNGDVMGDLMVI